MSSTTHDRSKGRPTNAPNVPAPGTGTAAQPPLSAFASVAYPLLNLNTTDMALKSALTDAITAVGSALGQNQKVAWSILCFTTNGSWRYAGIDDDRMHYSGSLLKAAAMYAAHELLAAAQRLAAKQGPHRASVDAFFTGLESTFDNEITAAATQTLLPGVLAAAQALAVQKPAFRATPRYRLIFDVTAPGVAVLPTVDFSTDFANQMRLMIRDSDNHAAGECVRRLSYTYLNASLVKAGFYVPAQSNGIWFAGDYTASDPVPSPVARTHSDNDQQAAQVTTTKQMLRLFTLIKLDQLVIPGAVHSPRMHTLLGLAAGLGGWFFFPPLQPPAVQPFDLVLSKIGRGPLKQGGETLSEGQLLKWRVAQAPAGTPTPTSKGLTGELMVCWQNMQVMKISPIIEVFRRTYLKLLS